MATSVLNRASLFFIQVLAVVLLTVAATSSCFSQEIVMRKSFGGVHYETDSLYLSSRGVLELLYEEPVPYREFKLARTNYAAANVLGFAGGVLIAVPVVTLISGGDPEWKFAAGGALLLIVSVPFNISFNRHAQHAIDEHNAAFFRTPVKTSFHFGGTGGRLVIRF